ncbi:pirin family protein [Colwelliaceae bacterium 6471]
MLSSEQRDKGIKELQQVVLGQLSSDGDGVKLTRVIGSSRLDMLDPFLLFDVFESDQPQDYIGGFPAHPHRGFETVTYMLAGKIRHKDSVGNEGVIEANGVQWMTAGRGIVHSEMPEQSSGLLKGFQLWVNLPKKDKMVAPRYQEFNAEEVALEHGEDGRVIRVISGKTDNGTQGPVRNQYVEPTYMDITLPAEGIFQQNLPVVDNSFVYVISGALLVGDKKQALKAGQLGILSSGDQVKLQAVADETQLLLVSAEPLNEPVARGGPFVMNTKAEVMQAFSDFQQNKF